MTQVESDRYANYPASFITQCLLRSNYHTALHEYVCIRCPPKKMKMTNSQRFHYSKEPQPSALFVTASPPPLLACCHTASHTPQHPAMFCQLRMAMDLLPDGSLGLYPCATPPQPCAQHNAWHAVSNPGRCDEKQRRRPHLGLHPGVPRFSHRTLRGMRELGQLGADNGSSSQLRCTPQHSAWV